MNVELDALANSVDALSDALLAESAHHVVLGNPSRAAATLDALERGEAPPPELEVIRTPRTGSAFTHRVVALFPGTPATIADWTATFRSLAEPFLNAWAAKLLGNPDRVRCVVERVNTTTGAVVDKQEFRLNEPEARAARRDSCTGSRPKIPGFRSWSSASCSWRGETWR